MMTLLPTPFTQTMNMEVSRKQTPQDTLSGGMSGNLGTIIPRIMGALSARTADVWWIGPNHLFTCNPAYEHP